MANENDRNLLNVLSTLLNLIIFLLALLIAMGILLYHYMPDYVPPIEVKNVASNSSTNNATNIEPKDTVKYWQAPDVATFEGDANKDLILYGKDLIAHTSEYFGKNGKIFNSSTNGMNCQNCHLDAGTRVVVSKYSCPGI